MKVVFIRIALAFLLITAETYIIIATTTKMFFEENRSLKSNNKDLRKQLGEATEIIRAFYNAFDKFDYTRDLRPLIAKAEQFLKESE